MANPKSRRPNSLTHRSVTPRIAPVVIILLLIALGAMAAPRLQDRDHDRDRDRFVYVSAEKVAMDFGGGHGGRPSPDAACVPESVAVGFHVQTGEYFNQAWLDCVHIRPDGDLGEDIVTTERTGTRGGRPVHDAFCPQGMALRGLRGRSGASIDEAAGICSPFHAIADRREDMRTELTERVFRPDAGGHPAEAVCPLGAVVTGFRSMSGEYMDHLWVLCSEVRRGR